MVLAAPLYSERSGEHLKSLYSTFLENKNALLSELLKTLVIVETRINQNLVSSPILAGMTEAKRLHLASDLIEPIFRPWLAFFQWSIEYWEDWPEKHIPALIKLAEIWTQHYEMVPNRVSERIGTLTKKWLISVEDYNHPEDDWHHDTNRAPPFELALRYDGWKQLEFDLRRVLSSCATSALNILKIYLNRLTNNPHLRAPREQLLETPQQLPALMPEEWVDMMGVSLLRRKRQSRERYLGASGLFENHVTGIKDEFRISTSSPLQLGWDQLFAKRPEVALSMMHRLEMRAAVYWRNREKRVKRRRPRPLILHLQDGKLQLWGDEAVYRWSRAILGPRSLGSAYLALDNWLHTELANGTGVAELLPRIIQNNGLVATTAPLINAITLISLIALHFLLSLRC